MKCVVLAGGLGTRISEETHLKPKPMIEIGGKPILWHIMKLYSAHGVNEFVICCGYRGYVIKEYFANYFLHMSDVTFDMANNEMQVHQRNAEPWKVTLVDTGERSMTGGRLRRVADYIRNDDAFCFTYGDGLSNVDIRKLVAFHQSHGKLATVTTVQPASRFGITQIDGQSRVTSFSEKPKVEGWVSAGFFVFSRRIFDYLDGSDALVLEKEPLERLAAEGQLMAYKHDGFFFPVDTYRDYLYVNELWKDGEAAWKVW